MITFILIMVKVCVAKFNDNKENVTGVTQMYLSLYQKIGICKGQE